MSPDTYYCATTAYKKGELLEVKDLNCKYPNYKNILPKENTAKNIQENIIIKNTVNKTKYLESKRKKSVSYFYIDDNCIYDKDKKLLCKTNINLNDFAFNVLKFNNMIRFIGSDKVNIISNNNYNAVLLSNNDYNYLLMPYKPASN